MLGIHRGESALVGWLVALFIVVQASHGLGANAADALFFLRIGVDRLPLMILLSGPAVMIFILGHASGLAYRGAARWLRTVTLICAGWVTVEWAAAQIDSRPVYPIIWISTQVIIMVSLTVMWNAAGAACTTRQAKRLFPIFATAGVAGGVLGNLLTGPLANLIGTPNLLLVQAGLLLGGSLLLIRARDLFTADDADSPLSIVGEMSNTLTTVRSSRFFMLAAVIAVAMFCLFYLVYFPFSEAVATSFSSEVETAAFLGIFSSIATAATFLFSLFVTNRLFTRLGLVVTLMILPIVYAVGFGAWLFDFTMATAAVVRGLQWVTVNAIALTAYTALFNVVTGRKRGQVVAFMTAVPAQVGVVLAGVVLIVTASMPARTIFIIGLVISLFTLITVISLRKEYLSAVVTAVRRGVIGVFDPPAHTVFTPADADSIRVLKDHLRDPRPGARALAVSGLGRLGTEADAADIEPLLVDTDPRVRSAAFDSVCAIEPERVSSHAASAVMDEVPDVRLQVLHYLAAHPQGDGDRIAGTALDDSDVRVRAAAATVVGGDAGEEVVELLLGSGDPRAVAAALAETGREGSRIEVDPTPYLDHDSSLVRAAAATAVPHTAIEPSALRPGLDDRSPRVRRASAGALAASSGGRDILIDVLATGSVSASETALQALTPIAEMVPDFIAWARRESERAALLTSYARAIDVDQPSPVRRYLLAILEMRSRRLVQWVLLAMTTRETRSIMPLVARGVRSSNPETKSQAIEALETIGSKDVLDVLLPLLEPDDQAPTRSSQEVLAEMATDFDSWLRSLAANVLVEDDRSLGVPSLSTMEPSETQSILDIMDRVLLLQGAAMFSGLDPEDLHLIARATTESGYEPGAAIYLEGEAADEILLIVEGTAVVTVAEGSERRLIQVYGPGDHVGELALLAGGPRSADVYAGDEGARGLALSTADLMSVLEERPTVALSMLGTLARRLIEQT